MNSGELIEALGEIVKEKGIDRNWFFQLWKLHLFQHIRKITVHLKM
jgi:hypothetical protein